MESPTIHDGDRIHPHDFLEFGLIDKRWYASVPRELGDRFRLLVENHEG
jgi:hypothetical protein